MVGHAGPVAIPDGGGGAGLGAGSACAVAGFGWIAATLGFLGAGFLATGGGGGFGCSSTNIGFGLR